MWYTCSMKTYFVDTETCGLTGVPILLQYAINDGPIKLVHLWSEPASKVMRLIEDMMANRVVAHNLRFDHFMMSKLYNMLKQCSRSYCLNFYSVSELVEFEWKSQFGPCLKPAAAVDTMLLASKSEDQSFLMGAKAVRIRRIPLGMSDALCLELNSRTELPWILFAGKKDQDTRWQVVEHKDRATGEVDPLWRDIQMSFQPSKGLKDLAVYLCNHESPAKFDEVFVGERPAEEGYAPFAKLLSSEERGWLYNDEKTWPLLYQEHIKFWQDNPAGQAYAEDDIAMLRKLYKFFGSPENDEDAMIACQVASVRLRGFAIDMPGCRLQHAESTRIVSTAKLNVNSPKQVLNYVAEALDEMEQLILSEGCDQKIIDEIKKEYTLDEREDCYCDGGRITNDETGTDETCPRCEGAGAVGPTGECGTCEGTGLGKELEKDGTPKKCSHCDGSGLSEDRKMPVVIRAEHIETIRRHKKRVELFDKLLLAKRAYPDFNVIGTKSGRMSGASGLNFQGIDHSDAVRSLFVLRDPGLLLSAGDYSSQELAIAATTMNDERLMTDMENGKSLHGLFGAEAFETTYEDIVNNKDDGRYGRSKGGVFAILYGGTFETVAKNMGIDIKIAEAAYNRMVAKYPQMGNTRKAVTERFSSMKIEADGHITYTEVPEKFIESVFGFRRYFETDYVIQKVILDTIANMPKEWYDIKLKVERTEGRIQTMTGAIQSALTGAGFSVQNKIIRASNNHVIQSTGRHLTIGMQAAVWDIQPTGIHPFKLTLMSIHDELAVVHHEDITEQIKERIATKVAEQCEVVPLTSIEWYTDNPSWAEKSDGSEDAECEIFGWSPDLETENV